jgi:hypothetical protein
LRRATTFQAVIGWAYVSALANRTGIPISDVPMYGSGEITDL